MADLCTIQDLELYLLTTITGDDSEPKYEYLITAVSKELESIMYRNILADDYVEILDATGTNSIFLNNYPLQSITSVKFGSPFGDVARDELTDFISYSDTAEVTFTCEFKEAPQMFEVTYNAGFTSVPFDINLICVEEVVRSFSESQKDTNLKSEKLGDYAYTLVGNEEIKSNLRQKLSAYIKSDI